MHVLIRAYAAARDSLSSFSTLWAGAARGGPVPLPFGLAAGRRVGYGPSMARRMRDGRESEIAKKFKYGGVGWIENRMRLWRTRRADLVAERKERSAAGRRAQHTHTGHDHQVMQPRQGVLTQLGGLQRPRSIF